MHIVSDTTINFLAVTVAGFALLLYIMRRRVRLGRRQPKF